MKKLIFLSLFLLITGLALIAQAPPVPPANAGSGGGPVGGGAPIDGGIIIVTLLAAGYGGKKVYNYRNQH